MVCALAFTFSDFVTQIFMFLVNKALFCYVVPHCVEHNVGLMRSSFLVFIFSPRCSKPVYLQRSVVPEKSSVLCAAFVPHFDLSRTSEVLWQENSQLYFLDTDQVIPIGVYFVSLKIHLVWVYTVQSNLKKILKYTLLLLF
jgi:hypothetical protein